MREPTQGQGHEGGGGKVEIKRKREKRFNKEQDVVVLTDENGPRECMIVQPGQEIRADGYNQTRIFSGDIGTSLASEELLVAFGNLLQESPTGCVLLFGTSGNVYYFRDSQTWNRWRDNSTSFKTGNEVGDTSIRYGTVEVSEEKKKKTGQPLSPD